MADPFERAALKPGPVLISAMQRDGAAMVPLVAAFRSAGCALPSLREKVGVDMKAARAFVLATGLACGAAPALAADLTGAVVVVPDDSLWLGHFSGGRNLAPGAEPIPLDWVDTKQRFVSLRDCSVWLKDLRRSYSTYEGWTSCTRIR